MIAININRRFDRSWPAEGLLMTEAKTYPSTRARGTIALYFRYPARLVPLSMSIRPIQHDDQCHSQCVIHVHRARVRLFRVKTHTDYAIGQAFQWVSTSDFGVQVAEFWPVRILLCASRSHSCQLKLYDRYCVCIRIRLILHQIAGPARSSNSAPMIAARKSQAPENLIPQKLHLHHRLLSLYFSFVREECCIVVMG